MKAVIFYALLESFFIELRQLIPLPNWATFFVSTYSFLAIPVIIITILYHILVLKSIFAYMTLLQGHYFGKFEYMYLVLCRVGTGTWDRPGSTGICSSISDPKGLGIRSAVVLASLKDNIDWFEARHMKKILQILWPWIIWRCRRHIFQALESMDHFWYIFTWT